MLRTLRILPLALLVGVSSLAAQQITRRDSAGVEIVTVPGAMLDRLPTWKLSAQPTLVIGGAPTASDPYLFDQLMGAARLADGTIAVADGVPGTTAIIGGVVEHTGQLRLFGVDGRLIREIGVDLAKSVVFSSSVRFIAPHQRGVLLWDDSDNRILVVDGNGQLVEDRRWNMAACNPQLVRGTCRPMDALLSGAIATLTTDPPSPSQSPPGTPAPRLPAVTPQRTIFGLYRGDQLTRIDSMPGPTVVMFQTPTVRSSAPRAFSPYPFMAVGNTQVVIGDGARYEIHYRDETRLVRILRVNRAAAPVTAQDLASFRAGGLISSALLDVDPPADSVPHMAGLNLDDAGRLWVSDYSAGPDGRGATIFDATGRPLARITLPTVGLQIFQIGADFVLGAEAAGNGTGADGRPLRYRRVVMYRIETGL